MKKLAFLGGAIGLGVGALLVAHTSHAADHIDAPAVGGAISGGTGGGQPMADIADVYAWMTSDAKSVNLAMTISPADDGTRHFSPNVLYVFHVTAIPAFNVPMPAGTETRVICQFASDTSAQCWVVSGTTTKDYISGDPSSTTGITSASQKVRLFAGHRSDPFFFNLQGFRDTTKEVDNLIAAGTVTQLDAAGCPTQFAGGAISTAMAGSLLRSCLFQNPNGGAAATMACAASTGSAAPPCATDSFDCFAHLNVIAIVLQVDATLVSTSTNPVIGVWGSTHASM